MTWRIEIGFLPLIMQGRARRARFALLDLISLIEDFLQNRLERMRRTICLSASVIAWCCLFGSAPAQIPGRDQDPTPEFRADVDRTDIYLNDSLEAAESIGRAGRLAGMGRWREAAELLQQAVDNAPDKLFRVSSGHYTAVCERVAQIIAAWPPEGIAAYQAVADPVLRARLDSFTDARSLDDLLALFDRYFCTSPAASLADTIAQLALEAGNIALARSVYQRVIESHPDRQAFHKRYSALLHLLYSMSGEQHAAAGPVDRTLRVRWMGQDRPLGDLLDEVASSFSTVRTASSVEDWTTFAGNAERNRRPFCRVEDPGILWRVAYTEWDSADDESGTGLDDGPRVRYDWPTKHPVIEGGLVFVQDSRIVVALHVNTGNPAWRFQADGAAPADSQLDRLESPRECVTVHEGRVYAVLPGDPGPYYGSDHARRSPEILCLDAKNGQLIWRTGQTFRPDRSTDFSFDPAPLVEHGRGYVIGRRRRTFGFEDCYLFTFDANSGTVIYRTHLGSAATQSGRSTITSGILCKHGDTLYACSNLGSIVAVSAATGAVRWLRLYDGPAIAPGGASRDRGMDGPSTILWEAGRIIVQPSDSNQVLVLSDFDGGVVRTLSTMRPDSARTVLGASGDLLCVAGREVTCHDLVADSPRWSAILSDEENTAGRGLWVAGRLFVPIQTGLAVFDIKDGKRQDLPWGPEGHGGNLLATADHLLVAGPRSLAAYVQKSELWGRLRERMAAAAQDPLPALELAEVALRSGDVTQALGALDEAARRAEAQDDSVDSSNRKRLYDAVLTFLTTLATRSQLEENRLEMLYRFAQQFAFDPSSHLTFRLRFASIFEERGQADRALALYQQVLRDQSLRALDFAPPRQPLQPASAVAEVRIRQCLERFGRTAFAPYETEARQWLSRGIEAGDRTLLARVAEVFPNSESAPLALVAEGELLERAGQFEEAARSFVIAYRRYPLAGDPPMLLKKIADTFEKAGQRLHAYRWLTRAAYAYPSAVVEHEGLPMTFLSYRERLEAVRQALTPSRPAVFPPLGQTTDISLGEGSTLLPPRFADDPMGRWSHVYACVPEGVVGFEAGSARRLWTAPVQLRPELLVATHDYAVFANAHEVFALGAIDGQRRWSHGKYPDRLGDPNADWEDGETLRTHALHEGRLYSVRDGGLTTCINLSDGRILWSQVHRPAAVGRLSVQGNQLVYAVAQDQRVMLCLLDTTTGQWQGAILTNEERAVEDLFLNLDGRPVLVTPRSVTCYDPGSRNPVWHVPIEGRVRRESIQRELDSLYLTDDGLHLLKIDLDTGAVAWRSDRIFAGREEELEVARQDGNLLVTTPSGIFAVESINGLLLWRSTGPKEPRFVRRWLTDRYVMALHRPADAEDAEGEVFLFDHRQSAGLSPKAAESFGVGVLRDLQIVLAADQSLWIQLGSTLRVLTRP